MGNKAKEITSNCFKESQRSFGVLILWFGLNIQINKSTHHALEFLTDNKSRKKNNKHIIKLTIKGTSSAEL